MCTLFHFSTGDIVGVYSHGQHLNEQGLTGVITKATDNAIHVAFEDIPEDINLGSHGNLQLVKLANDVTYRRLNRYV